MEWEEIEILYFSFFSEIMWVTMDTLGNRKKERKKESKKVRKKERKEGRTHWTREQCYTFGVCWLTAAKDCVQPQRPPHKPRPCPHPPMATYHPSPHRSAILHCSPRLVEVELRGGVCSLWWPILLRIVADGQLLSSEGGIYWRHVPAGTRRHLVPWNVAIYSKLLFFLNLFRF